MKCRKTANARMEVAGSVGVTLGVVLDGSGVRRSFTIVELIVAITVIAILAGGAQLPISDCESGRMMQK